MKTPEEVADELVIVQQNEYAEGWSVVLLKDTNIGGANSYDFHTRSQYLKHIVAEIKKTLADIIRDDRQAVIKYGVGDCPISQTTITRIADYRKLWQGTLKRQDEGLVGLDVAETLVGNCLTYIQHLEARIAWLMQEQAIHQVAEEAYNRGVAVGSGFDKYMPVEPLSTK